jgi:hypothetical protein
MLGRAASFERVLPVPPNHRDYPRQPPLHLKGGIRRPFPAELGNPTEASVRRREGGRCVERHEHTAHLLPTGRVDAQGDEGTREATQVGCVRALRNYGETTVRSERPKARRHRSSIEPSSCPSWARASTLLIQSRYRRATVPAKLPGNGHFTSIGARWRLETVRPRCPPSEAYATNLAIQVRSPLLHCLRSRPRRVLVRIRRLSLVAYQDQAASL